MSSIMRALGGGGAMAMVDKGADKHLSHKNHGHTELFNFAQGDIETILKEPAFYDAATVGQLDALAQVTAEGKKYSTEAYKKVEGIMEDRAAVFEGYKKAQGTAVRTHRKMETAQRTYAKVLVEDGLLDQATRTELQAVSDYAESFTATVQSYKDKFRSFRLAG